MLQEFQQLSNLSLDLIHAFEQEGIIQELPAEMEILKSGQYIKVIPIVIDGLIRVYTQHEDKELLLYYIKPNESCIMSFAASLKNEPSRVFAVTEEPTKALLLPVDSVLKWIKQFPDMNALFFQQYNMRYGEMLDTINHVLFDKLDKRLLDHLTKKPQLTGKNPIKISHRQIANELGTAREVISRTMKKLESEGLVIQHSHEIEIVKR